jgi:hypothetical protein
VQLPIRIGEAGSGQEQQGVTANASNIGVYIRTDVPHKGGDQQWRPGSKVEFEMTLPASVIGAPTDVVVQCRGRIVRVEKVTGARGEKRSGVACVIEKYEFVRSA